MTSLLLVSTVIFTHAPELNCSRDIPEVACANIYSVATDFQQRFCTMPPSKNPSEHQWVRHCANIATNIADHSPKSSCPYSSCYDRLCGSKCVHMLLSVAPAFSFLLTCMQLTTCSLLLCVYMHKHTKYSCQNYEEPYLRFSRCREEKTAISTA